MSAPSKRQRVRTGCLTCRSRRKKCDEGKPVCKNCGDRGLSCRYGLQVSFTEAKTVGLGGLDDARSPRKGQAYQKIKFINALPAHKSGPPTDTASSVQSHGSPVANTDEQHRPHQGSLDTTQGGGYHSSDEIQAPAEAASVSENSLHLEAPRISRSPRAVDDAITIGRPSHPLLVAAASPNIPHASSSHTSLKELPTGWTLPHLRGDPTPHHPTPAPGDSLSEVGPPIQYHFSSYERPEPDLRADEIALLRHYRYSIAPWLDLGDLDQPFGVLMLRATAGEQKLHRAILALSARHQELLTGLRRRFHITENTSPAHLNTESASDSTALATTAILDLADYLSVTPQEWRAINGRGLPMLVDLGLSSLGSDISKALFWFWLRLDLAAAVVSAQPPLMSLAHLDLMFHPRHSLSAAFQHTIYLLTCALHVAFGSPLQLPSSPPNTHDDHPLSPLQSHSPADRWKSVWSENQRWYERRLPELTPILDVKGGDESEKLDPHNESLFPIILFTTSLALIANVAYHISCLVLLDHKPRLIQLNAGPPSLTSTIWHAQRIAGMANCNRSPDCWDPLFIAGFLLAAKRTSHPSQHAAILNTLRRINEESALELNHEIVRLESNWSVLGNE